MKVTLNEHLAMVDQNSQAGDKEIASLIERMRKKFRDCGYSKIWEGYKAKDLTRRAQSENLIREYVAMILGTQDFRCSFWLPVKDDELNGVWNRPNPQYKLWKVDYIVYEIDHVKPVNAGGKDELTNYQFLSANANQFTKCSLTYEDLLRRRDLSIELKDRIQAVLKRREALFRSDKWKNFMGRLEKANEGR